MVSSILLSIQEDPSPSPATFSIALQSTNTALSDAAIATNKVIKLNKEKLIKKPNLHPDILSAAKAKRTANKNFANATNNPEASDETKLETKTIFKEARRKYRQECRPQDFISSIKRDENLHSILTNDPQAAYKTLRNAKTTKTNKISDLKVNEKTYTGSSIADGFFDSIKTLKTMNPQTKNCMECEPFKFDYELIKEISKVGEKIPPISLPKAESLLHSLKPSVYDHFNISALHYIHAGPIGIKHFQFMINSAIVNIENTTCEELNSAHANVLYKGHSKVKNLASS